MSTVKSEKIGLSTAITIGMKSMIGAGIFSITSLLGSKIGPAGILTYLFAFVAVWFIAQSFARIAFLYPQEGSFYNYAKQFGGHKFGLLSAGAYLFGLLIAMGLLCKIAGLYIQPLFPSIPQATINVLIVGLLMILNIFGVKLSSIGLYILLSLTLYALTATTLLCLSNFNFDNFFPFMPNGIGSVIAGTKVAVFGLFGFESIASLFNIMQNPEKNISKAVQWTILIVGSIYFVFIGSILLGIPQYVFADNPDLTIPQMLHKIFPEYQLLVQSIGAAILFAILGTVHAMVWASSQLMLSYFKFLKINWIQKQISKSVITAKTCVIICCLIILTACQTINNFGVFFSMTDVCVLFAFISAILPLLYLKNEWKSRQNYITMLSLITASIIFAEASKTLIKNIEPLLN